MKPERFKHLRRFSLRTLFVLMTICCLLAGAWSVYVNPFRLEQQSLATVNRLQGNSAKTGAEGPAWQRWLVTTFLGEDAYVHVIQVDLSGSQVDDKDLPSLSGLTHLEKLNLDNTQITDDGTAVLRAMRPLKELSLRYTNVSDRTASHMAALPALQTATLTGAQDDRRRHRRSGQAQRDERTLHPLDGHHERRRRPPPRCASELCDPLPRAG